MKTDEEAAARHAEAVRAAPLLVEQFAKQVRDKMNPKLIAREGREIRLPKYGAAPDRAP